MQAKFEENFFFFIQLDYRAFSIGSPCKSLWIKICHKREFSYTCIYMYKLVIILIKYRESPENLRVHVLWLLHSSCANQYINNSVCGTRMFK